VEYFVGVVGALAVAGVASGIGLDRDRSFSVTVLIVVAFYYVLFALMGASGRTVVIEGIVAAGFLFVALVGFRRNLWLVAAALVGHGLFDFVHHLFIDNPGVPGWWPGFCGAFDVLFGAWLAVLLIRRSHSSLSASFRPGSQF
jgi:hypothetical protein